MHIPSSRSEVAGPVFLPSEREMRNAQEVQAYLLPCPPPPLATLDYAGVSLPAAGLGGDCYDFLRPSPRRLAIAVGDVSGKGVPAALTMASLQAMLRTHYSIGTCDLAGRLASLNRLLFESTTSGHFATLFLGEYDDRTHRLRYANCGHVPPLLLRHDGSLERLDSTAMPLGIRAEWSAAIRDVMLTPGDTLVICTDGATEASNPAGEPYGDERLADASRRARGLPLPAVLRAIVHDVRNFESGTVADDLTVVVARARMPNSAKPIWPGRARGPVVKDPGGNHAALHPPR
jgi:serine phosphatase RsbU (regulator of sigma subunit)